MQEYVHVLGDVVKQARSALKLTQREVAESINADERTISNIEHYKGNPKAEILWPLIRVLGIDANDVFYPEKNTERNGMTQIWTMLSQCTEEELLLLLPICRSVISTFHSSQGIKILKK